MTAPPASSSPRASFGVWSVVLGGGALYGLYRLFRTSPTPKTPLPVIPGLGTSALLKAGDVYRLRANITPKVIEEDVQGMNALIRGRFGAIRAEIAQYAVAKDASLLWMDVRPTQDTSLPIGSARWNWTRPNGRKYELSFIDVGQGVA